MRHSFVLHKNRFMLPLIRKKPGQIHVIYCVITAQIRPCLSEPEGTGCRRPVTPRDSLLCPPPRETLPSGPLAILIIITDHLEDWGDQPDLALWSTRPLT